MSRGGRKAERKGQQQGAMETIIKVAVQRSDNWPATKWKREEKQERTMHGNFLDVADLFTHGGVKCCHRHKFDWNNGYIITKLLPIEDFVNVI